MTSTENQHARALFAELICLVCKGTHSIDKCSTFQKLSTADKWNTARKHKLCYSCLGTNHTIRECNISKTCSIPDCKEIHNPLLH